MAAFDALASDDDPVMTFEVGGHTLAIQVKHLDGIRAAERLWPVPFTRQPHLGLLTDDENLIPVRNLTSAPAKPHTTAQLVAVVAQGDKKLGFPIDRAGSVVDRYRLVESDDIPSNLTQLAPLAASAVGQEFWIINPERIWSMGPSDRSSDPSL